MQCGPAGRRREAEIHSEQGFRYLYLLVSVNQIIYFFSFACLGLAPEAQLLNCSGEIYVFKVFINFSMPDSVHRTVVCAFRGTVNVKALRSGQKVKVNSPVTGLKWPRGFQEVRFRQIS